MGNCEEEERLVDSVDGCRHGESGLSSAMSDRVRELVRRFMSRTEYFKEKAIQPPTPTSSPDTKSGKTERPHAVCYDIKSGTI